MKTRKSKIKSKTPSICEQVERLVEAFKCAVSLGINEGAFQRPHCRLGPDMQYKLRIASQGHLVDAWQKVGDIAALLKDWPILNDREPVHFYGTSGQSALEVVYSFTKKLAEGPAAFLPQDPEGWTQPRIRAEKDSLLARLHVELSRWQRKPLTKIGRLIYVMLKGLPEFDALIAPQIVDRLYKDHNILMDEATFRKRYKPELEPWGLKSSPKIGYYIRD
jgi:hypothetical protein